MTRALAGSQEVVRRYATLNGKTLKLECETYVGLSLSGEDEVIEAIVAQVRHQMTAFGHDPKWA